VYIGLIKKDPSIVMMVLINKVKCVDKFIFCKPNRNSFEASHEELLAYDCRIHVHRPNLDPTLLVFGNFFKLKICKKSANSIATIVMLAKV
jgi:hypothetical protein